MPLSSGTVRRISLSLCLPCCARASRACREYGEGIRSRKASRWRCITARPALRATRDVGNAWRRRRPIGWVASPPNRLKAFSISCRGAGSSWHANGERYGNEDEKRLPVYIERSLVYDCWYRPHSPPLSFPNCAQAQLARTEFAPHHEQEITRAYIARRSQVWVAYPLLSPD